MIGIIVGPTAALKPAIEGIAVEITLVTIIQAGNKKRPNLFKGFIKRLTRWISHLVNEITAAKPKAEQIAIIKLPLVIDLSNCLNATIGCNEIKAITKPEVKRTNLVSYLLTNA